jgi:peptidoglycan/xylan/chitin deacetylase (PgdA/CDA1 family)
MRRAIAAVQRKSAGGRRILIVSYHRVVEDFRSEFKRSIPGLLISKKTLKRQLEAIARAGYDFPTLDGALEVLAGRSRAKKDLCVVTFDDGYRDVYRHGFPVLRQLGIPAIIYLPTALVGTNRRFAHDRLFHLLRLAVGQKLVPRYQDLPQAAHELLQPILEEKAPISAALDFFIGEYPSTSLADFVEKLKRQLAGSSDLEPEQGDVMDWSEVRTMASAGIDFGAHTLEHTVLTLEPLDRVDREIAESKEHLERELGRSVHHFAYCNGWYSDEVIGVLAKNGFKSAVTTEDYPNRIGENPFTLKRKVLWENFSIGVFGAYSKSLSMCQIDDVFGFLSVNHPVRGRRIQRAPGVNARAQDDRASA